MREMSLREARAKLGELAEAANHGETIVLTKHGRPYALLTSLENAMTATDLRDHVTTATDAAEGEYDVDAIVAEIGETYGYDVDPERIDTAEYWEIIGRHATA